MSREEPRWTIRELGDQVANALAHDYDGPPSGQVSAVPGVRSIRYYAGLGLLDRPVEMRGRTAFYTTRHLLQLVAIKRLQEAGKSLAEVQAALTGASDRTLSDVARLPANSPEPSSNKPGRRRSASPRRSFWRELPNDPAAVATGPYRASPPDRVPGTRIENPDRVPGTRTWVELELAPGVRLQIEAHRQLTAADVEDLQAAAASLVQTVAGVGLRTTD